MRKWKNKRLLLLLPVLALFIVLALPVFAAQEGSLLIHNVDQPVKLYYVADAEGVLYREFSQWRDKPLTDKDATPKNAKSLEKYAREHLVAADSMEPDEKRQVYYVPLEEGFYLICSDGETAEFAPFMVQIPTKIADKVVYHIRATPKEDTEPPETTTPETPQPPDPDIPQTGNIQWPKYLLLAMGGVLMILGTVEIIRGRGKLYE